MSFICLVEVPKWQSLLIPQASLDIDNENQWFRKIAEIFGASMGNIYFCIFCVLKLNV